MAFTLDLTSLTDYINENRDLLISKLATFPDSTRLLQIQTGVTADTEIHGIVTGLTVQDGTDCGFSPAGSQTISGRVLTPNYLKVNAEWCAKDFLGTYMHYQTNIAMGRGKLPLEEALVNDIIKSIAKENERLIWSGNKSASVNPDLVDGFTTIINADTAIPAANKFASSKTTVLERVQEMYTKVNDNRYVILMSMPMYRQLTTDLINANFFISVTDDEGNPEKVLQIPGTDVKCYGIEGIDAGDTNLYGVILDEMFLGCDLSDDASKFDFWFSADARTYRLDVEYVLTVNYMYSDHVWVYSVATPEPEPGNGGNEVNPEH